MKTRFKYIPLMAFTALSLSLAACDDKQDDQATADQTSMTAPADTSAMPADTAATATMDGTTSATAAASMVQAEGATAYATSSGANTGAIFMTLHNTGSESDRLVSASTDKAASAEIHQSTTDGTGTMQMQKVDGVMVEAGQQVTLSPNGYHVMLMGLTQPLTEGETFNVTLNFEKGGSVSVPVTVTAAGSTGASSMDQSGMGGSAGTMSGTSGMNDSGTMAGNTAGTTSGTSGMSGTDTTGSMSGDTATGSSGSATTGSTGTGTGSGSMSGSDSTATSGSSSGSSYGSTMPSESMDSSPSATTDTPSATSGTGQ